MKAKAFTSQEVGQWMAALQETSTVEEYRTVIHTVRCLFDASNDKDFWNEACEFARKEMVKK